ncbi:MAG: prepilin-type N-terminal cleavage/methylation domain-containing protein, partial [Candidatus Omnitrophota bacterium]
MQFRNLGNPKAITLVELIIVLVILGIIFVFAIPSYQKSIERSRAKNAEFNLIAIYNAQKRYKLDTGGYYSCSAAPCDVQDIKENLGVEISDPYFIYAISGGATIFTAEAKRLDEGG